MTKPALPDSNADIVAVNLVYDAIIRDVHNPGHAIADLLEKMATFAREVGNINSFTSADWKRMVAEMEANQPEAMAVVDGHIEAAGDMWAHEWLLCNMARHLFVQLERRCNEFPFAANIESVEYAKDGRIVSWKRRRQ